MSTGSGVQPVWSRDGDRLVYRSGGWFVSARVRRTPDFAVVSRDTLFRDEYIFATNPHANFDITPDGGVVALQPTSTGERVVVSNWRAVLRAAMAQAAQCGPASARISPLRGVVAAPTT